MANGRHKKIPVDIPAWVDALTDKDACLHSVAEDAYTAKSFAEHYGALKDPRCKGLMNAAAESLATLENKHAAARKRCHEGDRAARKFWEAKVCARR